MYQEVCRTRGNIVADMVDFLEITAFRELGCDRRSLEEPRYMLESLHVFSSLVASDGDANPATTAGCHGTLVRANCTYV